MKKISLLTCVALIAALSSLAQTPELIKDITENHFFFSTRPNGGYLELNGKVYFAATDSAHSTELWETDGTAAGTNIVKDINVGAYGEMTPGCPHFTNEFTHIFNNEIYFNGFDSINGMALWKTDGTSNGTIMVKNIHQQSGNQNVFFYPASRDFYEVNGKLVFVSTDTLYGQELWVTDGTSAGTQLLKDINTDTSYNGGNSSPQDFAVLNNKLFFAAYDSTHGHELWVTDGTSAGTQLVVDLDTYHGYTNILNSSSPRGLFVNNNELYFIGFTQGYLYKTDGTTAGTVILSDTTTSLAVKVRPQISINSVQSKYFTEMGGKLYFLGEDSANTSELWVTDGSLSGTHMVKKINTGGSIPFGAGGEIMSLNNNQVIFCGSEVDKWELWQSDGTQAGTTQLKTLKNTFPTATWTYAYKFKNKIYFNARTDSSFRAWWVTDGTTQGTKTVLEPFVFLLKGKPITYNDRMYFYAQDTSSTYLWESEGDSMSTKIIRPIGDTSLTIDPSYGNGETQYYEYAIANGTLFFSCTWGQDGREPFKLTTSPITPNAVSNWDNEGINLVVYPNPSSDHFIIEDSEESTKSIWVYNSMGQLMYRDRKNFIKTEISTTNLAKGIYYLKVEKSNKYYSQSIVVR